MAINTTSFAEEVLDQASAWIVRLRSDQVTERDQQDFALWLAQSRDHQAAFDEMMVLWEAMGSDSAQPRESTISALMGKVSKGNAPPASNDCNGVEVDSPASTVNNKSASKPGRLFGLKPIPLIASFGSLAASVVVVALVILGGGPGPLEEPPLERSLYATPVGKQQRFTLEDGSVVELNTNSRVAVSYTDSRRLLQLLQGEAHFDVVPNPERPFVVSTEQGQVTAVGTAFNIQLSMLNSSDTAMVVTVTEGKIAVDAKRSGLNLAMTVGQQTSVDSAGAIAEVENADLPLVTAWREKTLIFRATDLSAALTELNRYLAHPVDVSDPSLLNLAVTGTFSLEEPEATLSAIIESFQLQSYKNPFNDSTRLYLR